MASDPLLLQAVQNVLARKQQQRALDSQERGQDLSAATQIAGQGMQAFGDALDYNKHNDVMRQQNQQMNVNMENQAAERSNALEREKLHGENQQKLWGGTRADLADDAAEARMREVQASNEAMLKKQEMENAGALERGKQVRKSVITHVGDDKSLSEARKYFENKNNKYNQLRDRLMYAATKGAEMTTSQRSRLEQQLLNDHDELAVMKADAMDADDVYKKQRDAQKKPMIPKKGP